MGAYSARDYLVPRHAEHWAADRFDRLGLFADPVGDDDPKSLFLREWLLHELGEQQGGAGRSESVVRKNRPAFDGFLQSNADRISDVARGERHAQFATSALEREQRHFQTAGNDYWGRNRIALDGLEIHAREFNSVSDLHCADPDFRTSRAS